MVDRESTERSQKKLKKDVFFSRLAGMCRSAPAVFSLDNPPTVYIFVPIADISGKPANQMIIDHIFVEQGAA